MSLKGLSDIQQKIIFEICRPYMEIETIIKKKSLVLSKATLEIIQNAQTALEFATDNNLQLPKSTYNVVRYGPSILIIFEDIVSYSKYEKIKKRVRKGIQYVQMLSWDKRALEVVLKNSDKPKIKSQDDIKIFRLYLKEFEGFFKSNGEEIFNKYKILFVAKNNKYTEHFYKGNHHLNEYHDRKSKIEKIDEDYKEIEAQYNIFDTKTKELETKIETGSKRFYDEHSTGTLIMSKRNNLSNLTLSPVLSPFIKLLGELINSFNSYINKQNIKTSFEVQGVIQSLQGNITSPDSVIDKNLPELIEQIIRYANRAFGKKHWYNKFLEEIDGEKNLKANLLAGPGYKSWYEARQISKDIEELEKSENFKIFSDTLNLLKNKLQSEHEEFSRIKNRAKKFTQDKEDLQNSIDSIISNMVNWIGESSNLV